MAIFTSLPSAFFFSKAAFSGEASVVTLRSLYSLETEIACASRLRRASDVHRRGHVVLRDLAGRDQVGHRRQDVRAVDAVALGAQHDVVARGAPGGLLGDLDIGHAVLGEEALLLGDDQRRGIHQRDVAEDRLLDLGPGGLRDVRAADEARLGRRDDGGRAARRLQEGAPCRLSLVAHAHRGGHPLVVAAKRVADAASSASLAKRRRTARTDFEQPRTGRHLSARCCVARLGCSAMPVAGRTQGSCQSAAIQNF